METTTKSLVRWLRWISVITTVVYLSFFFWKLWSRYDTLHTTGLDIDWTVPSNPQSMIALCLTTATLALVFLNTGGRVIAALLFVSVIAFYIQWTLLTKAIRLNMDDPTIHQEGWIDNLWVGAGRLDIVVLFIAIALLAVDLVVLWEERSGFTPKRQKRELRSSTSA